MIINREMTVYDGRDSLPSEEKAKPFKLVKYFTLISLVVIFLGALILCILNIHWAKAMQLKKSEDFALLLVENLNHQIFLQFIVPIMLKFGKIQLRNEEQFERLDKVVKNTLHSFKVEMVNIYDSEENIVSYSFDRERLGKKDIGGIGYQNAVLGRASSKLIQTGNFWELLFGFTPECKIITFAPLRAEKSPSRISGPIVGVIEIAQDLSEDYHAIFRFQIRVIITCAAVMSILFFVLLFVVNRGEKIIRNRNLERLKLKEQLSRAERLSSLGEMAAGISHEIRNPLGIIRSSAELLKKKMAAFDPKNAIPDIIVEEANRLNSIITDFLAFAKPRKPNLIPCRFSDIIDKNINYIASQAEAEGYIIEKDYDENLPEIQADADMIYQAFLNILINAMQSMPTGGRIWINVRANAKLINICFEDEGTGIEPELLERIWDPFFTTREKGTGLGLGIVKNIIESHGGTIRVENRSPNGARFTVQFPVSRD